VLGEGDLIYTKTLCRIGHEDYTDKTVLILGGGDGGILHELRKENVGFVTMAEIGIFQSGHLLICVCYAVAHNYVDFSLLPLCLRHSVAWHSSGAN